MNEDLVVKLALQNWDREMTRFEKLLSEISDEDMLGEVSPGKNRGIYLLGHLIAASDSLRTLLGFGDKHYPDLEIPFIKTPDKSGQEMPSVKELKEIWKTNSTALNERLMQIPVSEWFTKHSSISEEDFAKEPHRNKLNVLFTRTIHQTYHAGQVALLVKK